MSALDLTRTRRIKPAVRRVWSSAWGRVFVRVLLARFFQLNPEKKVAFACIL